MPATSQCVTTGTGQRYDPETETLIPTTGGGFDVAHALRADGFDASEDGTGRGTPLVPTYTLAIRGRGDSHDLEYRTDGSANAVLTPNGGRAVMSGMSVRRLTPLETERLMGQQDGYTAIPYRGKPAADGPRYKSHGNSWAINCVSWIGQRIDRVEAMP